MTVVISSRQAGKANFAAAVACLQATYGVSPFPVWQLHVLDAILGLAGQEGFVLVTDDGDVLPFPFPEPEEEDGSGYTRGGIPAGAITGQQLASGPVTSSFSPFSVSVTTARAIAGLPPLPPPAPAAKPHTAAQQQAATQIAAAFGVPPGLLASSNPVPPAQPGQPGPGKGRRVLPPGSRKHGPTAYSRGMDGFDGRGVVPGEDPPELGAEIPDVYGVLHGYRWWTMDAPPLHMSPARADEVWPRKLLRGMQAPWGPGENLAACRAGAQKMHPEQTVPDENCACVSPETRVLTSDLRWVPAGDLAVGEHVMAFDEYPADRGYRRAGGRKYRGAVVTCTDRDELPCYDLLFEDGTTVRVSSDHKWLCYSGDKAARWVRTDELRAGDLRASRVVKPFTPWDTDFSREAGYLAAAFDGEGHLFQGGARYQFKLGFAQVDNPMLAETERCLKEKGFSFAHRIKPRGAGPRGYGIMRQDGTPRPDGHILEMTARPEMMRFLGSVRPVRLLPKFRPDVLGRMNMANRVRLVRKTYVGRKEIVKLGTTAGTYFAEGLASHNCGFWAYWELQRHETGGRALPVCGVIEGYGAVLLGTKGFRAQKARIVALHLPFTIQPATEADDDPLGLGLPPQQPRATRSGYSPRTPSGQRNPWWNHPQFPGKVHDYGGQPDLDGDFPGLARERSPVPELSEPSVDERQAARDAAEAWMAVIGDRLAQMYPGAQVFETRALMEESFPPDRSYVPDESRCTCSSTSPFALIGPSGHVNGCPLAG